MKEMLSARVYTPSVLNGAGIAVKEDGSKRTAYQVLSFPKVTYDDLVRLDPDLAEFQPHIREQVSRDALYATYIARQEREIETLRKDDAVKIPADFDFGALSGLSNELKDKLLRAKPESLAQAARIEGMTPAALTLILASIRRQGVKSA